MVLFIGIDTDCHSAVPGFEFVNSAFLIVFRTKNKSIGRERGLLPQAKVRLTKEKCYIVYDKYIEYIINLY